MERQAEVGGGSTGQGECLAWFSRVGGWEAGKRAQLLHEA